MALRIDESTSTVTLASAVKEKRNRDVYLFFKIAIHSQNSLKSTPEYRLKDKRNKDVYQCP